MTTYTIVGFDETNGSIQIKYADNMPAISVDIPIKDGAYITGTALDAYIQGFIPTWHVERLASIQQGIPNVDEIKALVQPEQQNTQETAAQIAAWEQQMFENSIEAVLIKHGLISGT